jgi:hypothetical protein
MYVVYWLRDLVPQHREIVELTEALRFTEEMRKKQRDGEPIRFVSFVGENPNSVGNPGVDETGPDYNWKKRRI